MRLSTATSAFSFYNRALRGGRRSQQLFRTFYEGLLPKVSGQLQSTARALPYFCSCIWASMIEHAWAKLATRISRWPPAFTGKCGYKPLSSSKFLPHQKDWLSRLVMLLISVIQLLRGWGKRITMCSRPAWDIYEIHVTLDYKERTTHLKKPTSAIKTPLFISLGNFDFLMVQTWSE